MLSNFKLTRQLLLTTTFIIVLCLFFFFPSISFQGAQRGLLLWFQTVLPSLFPFMLLSNLMVTYQISRSISSLFYPIFRLFLPIKKEAAYPLVIGLLSGYPVGAKACNDLLKKNEITKKDAQFILPLCNNASPMFLTCYIADQCLNMPSFQIPLLLIVFISNYFGCLLVSFIYGFAKNGKEISTHCTPISILPNDINTPPILQVFDTAILSCLEILVKVGGYIILFSIFAEFAFSFLPYTISISFTGILEITTGIYLLSNSTFSPTIKIALTVAMATFGGLSSFAQTKSVIACSGLSAKQYFITKVICSILSYCITILLLYII